MKKTIYIVLILGAGYRTSAQEVNKIIREGNDHYKQQDYQQAAAAYAKALETDPGNTTARFNQANTLFRLDKKVDAAVLYTDVINTNREQALLAKAWYNKGVILSDQKNLEESIEAYRNALRNDPSDKEARENLQKAMLELKKKNPPKKQEQDQKKKQNQQQQRQQSKMSMKEVEQRLKLLQQKEKEVQKRIQKEKVKGGGSRSKDW